MLELFHTGYVVASLETAMAEIAEATGMSWRPIVEVPELKVRTETGEQTLVGRRAYSLEGPPYLELIQVEGEVWGRGNPAGEFHLGFWVDDLAEAAKHLESLGTRLVVSDAGPDGSFANFAYFQSDSGPLIEILPRWRKASILGEEA